MELQLLLADPKLRELGVRPLNIERPAPGHPTLDAVDATAGTLAEISRWLTTRASSPQATILFLLLPVDTTDWRFDAVLRRCAEHNIVALAGDFAPATLPPGVAALCSRLGVTLIHTPHTWAASVRCQNLVADTSGDVASVAAAAAQIDLVTGPDFEVAFAAFENLLQLPLVHFDAAGYVIHGDSQLQPALRELTAKGVSPGVNLLPHMAELVAVPMGISVGSRGWLGCVTAQLGRVRRAEVKVVLQVAASALVARLALRRLAAERSATERRHVLRELTESQSSSPELLSRTVAMGWDLAGFHAALAIVPAGSADIVGLRHEVLSAFAAEGVALAVVEHDAAWLAWASWASEPSAVHIANLTRAARQVVARLPDVKLAVGISHVGAGRAGLAAGFGPAMDAARLARARPQAGHVVHIDQLGLAQLLLSLAQTETFGPAASELLAPLSPALLETLAAFLDAESNVSEAAAVLGVHRNTVAERVARVQRVLGVDLRDADVRLALHLATRAL